jgi:(S)-2-hydroxyglutarate dehydrogenase
VYDFAIIGGGILGLATGAALGRRCPSSRILLLEKEADWAQHQTGRNSGVIHSGIYYKPGSLKAKLAREGSRSLVALCREHGIAHEVCGKVIVATEPSELPLLDNLFRRGVENGLLVTRIEPEAVREIEPHVRCLGGIRVPTTGIVDYRGVCRALARLMEEHDADLRLRTEVRQLRSLPEAQVIETSRGSFKARFVINCAGLYSDRVARLGGVTPGAQIIPFRGEYYELRPESRYLVKNLIYPVPNPNFPFLGVHFTRMIDGSVHAGPNAVLSLKREGYRKTDCNWRDITEVASYAGFWKLAFRYPREGLAEVIRSISKAVFTRSLQRLIPAVRPEDLVTSQAGVRAQALRTDGTLVDDFLLLTAPAAIHVCNAPSPAATASLEIAEMIVDQVPEPVRTRLRRNAIRIYAADRLT